ncbi:MAG: Flp family type IVb pilin [Sphingomicrobium sp.]
MIAIRTKLRKLGACARGATAIEYGLICALIIIAMMGGLQALGGGTNSMWGNIKSQFENAG